MPLWRRRLQGFDVGGVSVLGGVRRSDDVLLALHPETSSEQIRRSLGHEARILGARGIPLASTEWTPQLDQADATEPELLASGNVLFGFHTCETEVAVCDWLNWHRRFLGADSALIHASRHADVLEDALSGPGASMRIVLVEGDADLSPETFGFFELLRHRFLSEARAVACLSISDLLMQDRIGTPFDRAAGLEGEALALTGSEIFPWRLRQGKPAHHGDHVAARLHDIRRLASWCVAPGTCSDRAVWRPNRIGNMPLAEERPAEFRRAMGVAHPGVTIGKLVSKGTLIEDPVLVEMMSGAYKRRPPVRRPARRVLQNGRSEACDVTIVTAMKNEGPFILDWIAHHRAIGIERFVVYTNDCEDGTDRLLDLLVDTGVVRRDNPHGRSGQPPQRAAFRAAEAVVRDAGWLLTLDVDEYLNIHAGDGFVSDLFAATPGAGAISIPWRLFGNADRHRFEDTPVVRLFPLCAPEYAPRPLQAWAFKTLYRNDGTFGRIGVHRPNDLNPEKAEALHWVEGTGRPLPRRLWQSGWRMTPECWGYEIATINHYAVRSAESFLVKRERGRVNHVGHDQGAGYWFRMNHNVTEDHSIRRFDDRVAAERDRLCRLPGVSEAHSGAVDWHRSRIARLRADADYAAFYAEITGPRLQKLSRMTPNFGSRVFYTGPQVIPDAILERDVSERFYFGI